MIRSSAAIEPAQVAEHYDHLDQFYREVWGEHLHHGLWLTGDEPAEVAVRRLVEHVAAIAGIVPGSRVCDLGCGYGATARLLAAEYGAAVTGITVSPAQFAYARSLAAEPAASIVLGDWMENDFPDGSFDVVLALESTEHIADKRGCLREAYRVLAPRGRLVVCAWLAAERPRPWQVRHLLEPICREGRLPALGTASEYRTWLREAGFTVERFADLTSRVRRTWSICVRRTVARLLAEPAYLLYVLSPRNRERVFARTLPRMLLAYRTRALRYGLLAASCTPGPISTDPVPKVVDSALAGPEN